MMHVDIITESCFEVPFLRIQQKKTYVTGERYKLRAKMTNMDKTTFQGGHASVVINWPNGLVVTWNFKIPSLSPGETFSKEYGESHVLDDGPGLFFVRATDNQGNDVRFCDSNAKPLPTQLFTEKILIKEGWGTRLIPAYHLLTILPKSAEQLYQLWALLIAIAALIPILVNDAILPFLHWLVST